MKLAKLGIFIVLLTSIVSHDPPKPKRKRYNQELKQRIETKSPDNSDSDGITKTKTNDALFSLDSFTTIKRESTEEHLLETVENVVVSPCPPCEGTSLVRQAIDYYWRNDLNMAYACACNHLLNKRSDGFAQSIQYSLSQTKYFSVANMQKKFDLPATEPPNLKTWEILGPINVGKLEVDADSTFFPSPSDGLDVAQYILSMRSNESVFSELMIHGVTGWRNVQAKKTGEVTVCSLFIFSL